MSLWKYNRDVYRISVTDYRFIYVFVYINIIYSFKQTFWGYAECIELHKYAQSVYLYIAMAVLLTRVILSSFGTTILCWHNSQNFTHIRCPIRLQKHPHNLTYKLFRRLPTCMQALGVDFSSHFSHFLMFANLISVFVFIGKSTSER